jgi:hypothetical protein
MGNHPEKLRLRRMLCASEFTIADMAGTTFNAAGYNSDTRFSKPNQPSCTTDLAGVFSEYSIH